jgi:hypothetical protein
MDDQQARNSEPNKQTTYNIERFLELTFERLPVDSKVLIGLFAALNSSSGLTQDFDLPDRLWEIVRFGGCGPLVGQSEEVNWLKGISDGILLVADHV